MQSPHIPLHYINVTGLIIQLNAYPIQTSIISSPQNEPLDTIVSPSDVQPENETYIVGICSINNCNKASQAIITIHAQPTTTARQIHAIAPSTTNWISPHWPAYLLLIPRGRPFLPLLAARRRSIRLLVGDIVGSVDCGVGLGFAHGYVVLLV